MSQIDQKATKTVGDEFPALPQKPLPSTRAAEGLRNILGLNPKSSAEPR